MNKHNYQYQYAGWVPEDDFIEGYSNFPNETLYHNKVIKQPPIEMILEKAKASGNINEYLYKYYWNIKGQLLDTRLTPEGRVYVNYTLKVIKDNLSKQYQKRINNREKTYKDTMKFNKVKAPRSKKLKQEYYKEFLNVPFNSDKLKYLYHLNNVNEFKKQKKPTYQQIYKNLLIEYDIANKAKEIYNNEIQNFKTIKPVKVNKPKAKKYPKSQVMQYMKNNAELIRQRNNGKLNYFVAEKMMREDNEMNE
jgi:hypothetical protein